MAATPRAGAGGSQEPGETARCSSLQALGPSSAALPRPGAESWVGQEQPEQEPVAIWDAGAAGSSLTLCICGPLITCF